MKKATYRDSGVDIEKGDRFADFIKGIKSKAVSKGIGGFAGGLPLKNLKSMKEPVLLSSTDGVGTKLIVAQKLKKFDTIGIDLVAMCVNDLAVCGCMPLVFLDYIACGTLQENLLQEVMKGIVTGCEEAECTLSGGETAEMPDMYKPDDFDLAGFCVGIADKSALLPNTEAVSEGDVLIGLPSAGVHSNGLSLARKAFADAPEHEWEELLVPTKIYVKEMKSILANKTILGAAHITGGGLEGNVARILPEGLRPHFFWDWEVPKVFHKIQKYGSIDETEMRKVFNMGIGIIMCVKKQEAQSLVSYLSESSISYFIAGEVKRG